MSFIVTFAAVSTTALLLFIPWELNRSRPLIDLNMLTSRQFGTCFLVMLGTGALLIATTQALPQLLQDQYGYTATWAGLAISPGGPVTMGMMLIVGRFALGVATDGHATDRRYSERNALQEACRIWLFCAAMIASLNEIFATVRKTECRR